MSRMHERYRKEVVPALMKRLGKTNPMAVPKISKVIVNIGMGEDVTIKELSDRGLDPTDIDKFNKRMDELQIMGAERFALQLVHESMILPALLVRSF